MQVINPLFLLLLLGLIPYFIAYKLLSRKLHNSWILVAVIILLTLSISDVQVKLTDDKREFFVLIDSSPSMKHAVSGKTENIFKMLEPELKELTAGDALTLMTFSREGQIIAEKITVSDLKQEFEKITWSVQNSSVLSDSILSAITQFDVSESAGLLVVTDGGVADSQDLLEDALLKIKLQGIKTKLMVVESDEPKKHCDC